MDTVKAAYYTGSHHYSYRPGESAEILAVRMATPEGLGQRPVFVVMYADGEVDSVPISEAMARDEISDAPVVMSTD